MRFFDSKNIFLCFNRMEIEPNWDDITEKVPEFSLKNEVKKAK